MRISGGMLKGKEISLSAQVTHPMGERQRLSLFNSLGDIEGLVFIDAFAGTGIVGFEALSRGAQTVYAVEKNPRAFNIMIRNAQRVLPDDLYAKWVPLNMGVAMFMKEEIDAEIVVADPPYSNVKSELLESLTAACHGVYVVSMPSDMPASDFTSYGLVKVKESVMAGAKLVFYKSDKIQ